MLGSQLFTNIASGCLVGALLGAVLVFILRLVTRKKFPLPPYANASMVANVRAALVQKSLHQLERQRKFSLIIERGDFGGSELGATFRMSYPLPQTCIITTDQVLARAILLSNTDLGVKEAERSVNSQALNLVDRKQNNILTSLTSDKEREAARKAIAPAFSTSNLASTWPNIKKVVEAQLDEFRKCAENQTVIDMKSTVVMMFMKSLSRGAFGVGFTTDGTEDESNIDGLAFLQALEDSTRESARQFIFPLRRLMFWAEGVKRSAAAKKVLEKTSEKIIRLHKDANQSDTKPRTVLDHVVHHAYTTPLRRVVDVAVLGFAAIDTTSHTLAFLLMELARHPDIQDKLYQELHKFMPAAQGPPSADDKALVFNILGCEFLNQCVREAMRLWPVAGSGPGRDLTHDVHYRGMLLPRGAFVVMDFYSMFRERWIHRADEYRPERWAESNPQLPQLKEMFMPFGLGRRACLGQNMALFQLKLVAAHFLRRFAFELVEEPTFEVFITLKPYRLKMRVIERK